MKNKRGEGEKLVSIYWFVILIIITLGVVAGTLKVFGEDIDIREAEASLLKDKVVDCLIEKGKSSEQIGKEAAEKLKLEIKEKEPVDRNLADQLIPFVSLLSGSEISAREISKHSLTNIYVIEQFLNLGFKIEGNKIQVLE